MEANTASNEWRNPSNGPNHSISSAAKTGDRERGASIVENAPLHKHSHSNTYVYKFTSATPLSVRRRERDRNLSTWESGGSASGADKSRGSVRKREWETDRESSSRDRHFRDRDRDNMNTSDRDNRSVRDRDWNRSNNIGLSRENSINNGSDREWSSHRGKERDWENRKRDRDFFVKDKFRDRDRDSMPPRNSKHFFRPTNLNSDSQRDRSRDFRDNGKRYTDRKWIGKRDIIRDRKTKTLNSSNELSTGSGSVEGRFNHYSKSISKTRTDTHGNITRDYYGPTTPYSTNRDTFKNSKAKEPLTSSATSDKDKDIRLHKPEKTWEKSRDPRLRDNDPWAKRELTKDREWDRDKNLTSNNTRSKDVSPFTRRLRTHTPGNISHKEENDKERKHFSSNGLSHSSRQLYNNNKLDDQKSDSLTGNTSVGLSRRPQHSQNRFHNYTKNSWFKRPRSLSSDSNKFDMYVRPYVSKPKFSPPSSAPFPSDSLPLQRSNNDNVKTDLPEVIHKIPTDPRTQQNINVSDSVQSDDSSQKRSQLITRNLTTPQDPRHLNDPRRFQNTRIPVVTQKVEHNIIKKNIEENDDSDRSKLLDPPSQTLTSKTLAQDDIGTSSEIVSNHNPTKSSQNTELVKNQNKRLLSENQDSQYDPRKKKRPYVKPPEISTANTSQLTCASLGSQVNITKAERIVRKLSQIMSVPLKSSQESLSSSLNEKSISLPTKDWILEGISKLDLQIKNKNREVAKLKEIEKKESENDIALKENENRKKRIKERMQQNKDAKLAEERRIKIRKMKKDMNVLLNSIEEVENTNILSDTTDEELKYENKTHLNTQENSDKYDTKLMFDEKITQKEEEIVKSRGLVDRIAKEIKSVYANVESNERKMLETKKMFESINHDLKNSNLSKENEFSDINEKSRIKSLVQSILDKNQYVAMKAQLDSLSSIHVEDDEVTTDECLNNENKLIHKKWNILVREITGQANALYIDPKNSPFFDEHKERHAKLKHRIAACVQKRKRKVWKRWEELVHEYFIRQKKYISESKQAFATFSSSSSHPDGGNFSIMGGFTSNDTSNSSIFNNSRSNANPYRRPRREARSEYEQEQIIAELNAKEAMERRITQGSCILPRQRCGLEQEICVSYHDDQNNRLIRDPISEEESKRHLNPWTDIEKCIFLDRFLQDPKDFHKISKSLRNKTTKDCIEFYYNSKKSIPYKAALREYHMRRKRRGDISWDATIQAAISVGAIITEGPSQEKPVLFSLVENDNTYYTHHLHPIKKDVFDSLDKEVNSNTEVDVTSLESANSKLFTVDGIKFLRTVSSGDLNQHTLKKKKEDYSDSKQTNVNTGEYSKEKENESSKNAQEASQISFSSCNDRSLANSDVDNLTEEMKSDKGKLEKELDKITMTTQDRDPTVTLASLPSNGQAESSMLSNLNNVNPTSTIESMSSNPRHISNYVPHIQQGQILHNNKNTIPHNSAMRNNGSYPFLPPNSMSNRWMPNSNLSFQLDQATQYVGNSDAAFWLSDPRNRGHSNVISIPPINHYDNMLVQMSHPHMAIKADRQEAHKSNTYFMEFGGRLNQAMNGERSFPDVPINGNPNGHTMNGAWGNKSRYSPHKDVN